ncbi:MAG: PLP-dependent aspartate aminotransferase family protein [Chloroflexota bacterium]|nr:PLP-dependent aspartate aminotransferase family protein [Chloroflexota bacterium]
MPDTDGIAPDEREKEKAREQGFATRAVHAGLSTPLQGTRPTVVPIYATSTFLSRDTEALDGVLGGTLPGYVYGRYANPTVTALEDAVSALEGAAATVAFGSGMAALHAALLLCELEPGSVVLAGSDLYGASHTLLATLLGQFGVETRFVDMTDLEAVRAGVAQSPVPRVLLFEPLSNPLIKVADVQQICDLARAMGATTILDSTFTPPPLLQPLKLGADIVVHSATKYYGGHGDATGGLVCLADNQREEALRQIARLAGAVLGPFDAYLIGRGARTLVLRLRKQCENAASLATWLSNHPGISRVYYPGLPDHPQHELASKLLQGPHPGAMLAFEINEAGREEVFAFFDALELILPVTTLGDVYTEVSYPPISSHRGWAPGMARRAGITAGLVRLSVGIEDVEDLMEDIEQALTFIATPARRPA